MKTETMTRREFNEFGLRLAAGAAVLATVAGPLMGGCNWVQDVENWTETAEESIASIESILAANGVTITGAVLNDVNAAIAAVHEACVTYLATNPPPATALAKVEAALTACSTAIGQFITALGLPGGGLLTLVTQLGEFLLSTIAGFVNEATAASGSQTASVALRVNGNAVAVTPKLRTRRAYKKGWNALLHSGQATVPAGAYLKLTFWQHF